MDNSEKDSYKIGKVLQKLTGIKFLKTKQTVDLSREARSKSQKKGAYSASNKRKSQEIKDRSSEGKKYTDQYVHFQKEVEANKLLGIKEKLTPPGRILKLPVRRRELMSKSDD